MIKREWDHLFSNEDLASKLDQRLAGVRHQVRKLDLSRLAEPSADFLVATTASEFVVSPLELFDSEISVSSREVRIDVSHDFERGGWGGGPTFAEGLEITYHVPFAGDASLLRCRPSTYGFNPPRAVIRSGELAFPYDQPDRNPEATKGQFAKDLAAVKELLGQVNQQVAVFNQRLEAEVGQQIAMRRQELEQTKAGLESLGYPIRPAESTGRSGPVYAAPANVVARRKARREQTRRSYDVALSFAGEDREYVEKVAGVLTRRGIEVFYDQYEQVGLWGKDLAEHFGVVYGTESKYVVLFASRHYAAKAWATHEKQFALGRLLRGEKGCVLPVRLDDTDIPGLPPTIMYLDVRVLTPEKLAELIIQKLDSDTADT